MTINDPGDLKTLFDQRAFFYATDHRVMDDLVGAYNGVLPEEFDEFFPEEMHVHLINMIRLAWDDLSALAGKTFQLYVRPDNDSATAKERAEKQEMIGYGYNKAGRPAGGVEMDLLMKVLMWWLVGTANAVLMTLPDYEHQSPFFTFRDPRTHYPPVGWNPYNQTKLEDSLFAYRMSVGELAARYPHKADEIRQSLRKTHGLSVHTRGPRTLDEDEIFLWVGEYYHEDAWWTATLEDKVVTLVRSESGDKGHPGVMPVVPMSLYNPDTSKGRSIFADQVSVQAAMARMFSQKLDYYDRTLYPIIFTTPLAGKTIKIGPLAVNEYDVVQNPNVNPRVDSIGPTHTMESDQTMQFAIGMSRMLNRNPESFQGGGEADSAKALRELMSGVDRVVRSHIWPAATGSLPVAYTSAAKMDINLWPNTSKKSRGVRKNVNFAVTYRPRVDLKDREYDFEVEPGIAVGGYQGMLQLMQLVQAELLSEDTALEQMEDVPNAREEKRRIQNFRMEKLIWADLQAKAGQGLLQPGALNQIKKAIQNDKVDLFDAIEKLEKEGRLTTPPPEMAAGPAGAPAPGGLESVVPSLDALRRGM